MDRGPQRLTLSDVARVAGLGESTVSRVLRSQGAVSPKAREKVAAAVAKLGYVPNRIAGMLASEGSALIAIVVPSLSNSVFPDVLAGAERAIGAAGFQSVIGVSEYDPAREEAVIRSMLSLRPAGMLIAGVEHSEGARAMLSGLRTAEVMDLDGEGLDIVVGFSNRAAGAASARHLLTRGYRRIGYVGHDVGRDRRAGKRLAGFCAALAESGLTLVAEERTTGRSSIDAGRQALDRLMRRAPGLDAVYFSNDDMALGGYFHCLSHGIAIPAQLALFGFNGLDVGQATPQPLSSIRTPRVQVGEEAAKLIVTGAARTRLDLGFTLIEGSTA